MAGWLHAGCLALLNLTFHKVIRGYCSNSENWNPENYVQQLFIKFRVIIWAQTPWPRSPSVTITFNTQTSRVTWTCHVTWACRVPKLWLIPLKKLNILHYDAKINNKSANKYKLSKKCGPILVKINQNVAHERTDHELWPGFCSN